MNLCKKADLKLRSICRFSVAILLVCVMVFSFPVRVSAARARAQTTYIKDVKMVVAANKTEAKNLLSSGYKLVEEPLYAGGKSTFLAYLETSDPEEAITDMRAMNMNGGWSYEKYEDFLEQQKENVELILVDLVTAISEFRENYQAQSASALYAYDILQMFYEDDSEMLLGDFILTKALEEPDQLETVALQCNGEVFVVLEKALMIGCQDTLEGTFAERLSAANAYDCAENTFNKETANEIISGLGELQTAVRAYENSGHVFGVQTEEEIKAWTEGAASEDVSLWYEGYYLSEMLRQTPYEGIDGEETAYDLFVGHQTSLDREGNVVADFSPNTFYAAASVLSDGQAAMIKLVGITGFLLMEQQTVGDYGTARDLLGNLIPEEDQGSVSVYAGVDRSVFDAEGIAMTSKAMQQIAANNETDWAFGETGEGEDALKLALIISGGLGALALLCTVVVGVILYSDMMVGLDLAGLMAGSYIIASNIEGIGIINMVITGQFATSGFFGQLGMMFAASPVFAALGAITIGILLIVACLIILFTYFQSTPVNEWAAIPRKIMNAVEQDGETQYIYYDCVAEAAPDASGAETGTGKYMDVGNWESGAHDRQWVAIYMTKDHRAGKPITASNFTVGVKPSSTSGFVSLRKFNEDPAYNLATYSKASGSLDKVYVSYKPDSSYTGASAASVFSEGSSIGVPVACGAGGLLIGLLAGVGIGFAAKKKKKEADA